MASKWTPFKKWQVLDYLSPTLRQKFRETFSFVEATGASQYDQSPVANDHFREPAPTSQAPVSVPTTAKETVYNTQYYTRDIKRHPADTIKMIHPSLVAITTGAPMEVPKQLGSPGNKNPAVLAYDPTGTRSAMTTTNEETEKLILQHRADHQVRCEWEPHAKDIIAEYTAKGLPPVPGRRTPWDMPAVSRERRW